MAGLPVCEEETASSPRFTDQNVCLVLETHAFVLRLHNRALRGRNGDRKTPRCTFINQHEQQVCGSWAGQAFRHCYGMSHLSPPLRELVMAPEAGCPQHISSLGISHCILGQFESGAALPQGLLAAPSAWPGSAVTLSSPRSPCNGSQGPFWARFASQKVTG